METGDYRSYLQTLLTIKQGSCTPTAMTKTLGSGIVCFDNALTESDYPCMLEAAKHEFGGTVGVYVHYHTRTQKWQAVAVFQEDAKVLVKTSPLSFTGQRLKNSDNDKELSLSFDSPTLFRVSSWIARTVFELDDKNPFPLLHRHTHEMLDLYPTTNACYTRPDVTMTLALQQMDMIIANTAIYSQDFDSTVATIVDILHCFGVVYVGSVNEMTSEAEAWSLNQAIVLSRTEGWTHLWWFEDSTLFEDDQFNLVVRFSMGNKPYYIKRKMTLVSDNTRLQDKVTGLTSCALVWDYHDTEAGILAFTAWIESFLPKGARALPYMRQEIVDRYVLLKPKLFDQLVRPFLVKGVPGTLATVYNTDLPPRLSYSPDLFVEKSKIPKGLHPSTVHFDILVKPWVETCDLQLFLRVEGDADHAYRVLCHKNNTFLPEPGQLKAFVESANPNSLREDAIQIVVLKRTLAPWGAIAVEFIVTTYWKPFRIYVDNQLCDYVLRYTVHHYCPSTPPQVFAAKELLVFTKKVKHVQAQQGLSLDAAVPKALERIEKEGPQMIPLLFANSNQKDMYTIDTI